MGRISCACPVSTIVDIVFPLPYLRLRRLGLAPALPAAILPRAGCFAGACSIDICAMARRLQTEHSSSTRNPPESRPMSMTPVLISPVELQILMSTEPVVVIDTRDADTYAAGHVPGAVNLREIFTYPGHLHRRRPAGAQGARFTKHFGAVGLSGARDGGVLRGRAEQRLRPELPRLLPADLAGLPRRSRCSTAATRPGRPPACRPRTEAVAPVAATFPSDLPTADVMLTKDAGAGRAGHQTCCSTCATSTSGSARAPRPTARTSRRARAACRARSGSSGTAS